MAKSICSGDICCVPFKVIEYADGGFFDCGSRLIGVKLETSWQNTLSILLHETIECVFALKDIRFLSNCGSPDTCVFQFDHGQFTTAMKEAAIFIEVVEAPLRAAWKKVNNARR